MPYRSSIPRVCAAALIAGLLGLTSAAAQDAGPPAIAGYGKTLPSEGLANPPDKAVRYRVVFEITRAAAEPGQVNPALERVARFMNVLSASGVRPLAGDVVVVIHGPATPSVLDDAAYATRFNQANPNTALFAALRRAGVDLHVCNFALANAKIDRASVTAGITVDVAAMVTLATLQLKGWAIISG